MNRKLTLLAAHPTCHFCPLPIGNVDDAMVVGREGFERLVHKSCFVRALCRVNPTFSKQVARERAKRGLSLVA